MPSDHFMINTEELPPGSGRQRDIITSLNPGVRIHVYYLSKEVFHPNKEELQFFGWHNKEYIAFETESWCVDHLHRVTAAIQWYAAHVDCPNMDISLVPPRSNLRLV